MAYLACESHPGMHAAIDIHRIERLLPVMAVISALKHSAGFYVTVMQRFSFIARLFTVPNPTLSRTLYIRVIMLDTQFHFRYRYCDINVLQFAAPQRGTVAHANCKLLSTILSAHATIRR